MPVHYARHQFAAPGAVAKLRYQAGRGSSAAQRARAAGSGLAHARWYPPRRRPGW